jgi:hypothetical protein
MEVMDADEDRAVQLLLADVTATIGVGHDEIVRANARRLREFCSDAGDYLQRVVDDVQQQIHDEFIDTSWPECPIHKRHPLSLREHGWWCEQNEVFVATLGELGWTAPSGWLDNDRSNR